MARGALYLSFAFLFLASVIPSEAQKTEAASGVGEETLVTVAAGQPLAVQCRLRPEQRAEWRRDGAAPPADLHPAPETPTGDARLAATLRAQHARTQHAGLYTCSRDQQHRVRVVVLPVGPADPTAAAASVTPPAATIMPDDAFKMSEVVQFDVRGNITLLCTLPNTNNLEYIWLKNGTELGAVWDLKDRFKLERGGAEFYVIRAVEDDFGNYTCKLRGSTEQQQWAVHGRPHLKLPANSNVVEGQKLKLTCKVIGKPYPPISWSYSNASEGESFAPLEDGTGAVSIPVANGDAGAPGAVLLLEAAARNHAGRYRCSTEGAQATTTLRVKDMYAALWPFLGICAEVFVLCAIILLYEKRRTKPDLDDSDTDNHDQKKS